MGKTILEQEIEVYRSMKDSDRYIAVIRGFDFIFRAPTPMLAHRRADEWRKARWNEIAKPGDRVEISGKKRKVPPEPKITAPDEVEP